MSPPRSSDSRRENFRKRRGRLSAGMPRPRSETETATWTPSTAALTRSGDDSGECLAALFSRLCSTCPMRSRSAITQGRFCGTSSSMVCSPPPLMKALRASYASTATSVGSGEIASVPVSMRATSSRSPTSACMRSICESMMWKNCRDSVGFSVAGGSSSVATDPFSVVSGVRSSWLTIARNSARMRSISWSAVMSCIVMTIVSTSPPSARIGVAFTSVVTLRPSGDDSTTSSARMVSPAWNVSTRERSRREISWPFPRRMVSDASTSPGMAPSSCSPLTIRAISWL